MTADGTQFGKIDLNSCDREPIHIPGSIQSHGVLLVVGSRDLDIRQFAGDTRLLLSVGPEDMAPLSLPDLFDEQVIERVAGRPLAPASGSPAVLLGITSRTGRLPLDITIHSQDGHQGPISIIELEQGRCGAIAVGNSLSQVRSMLAALQSSGSFEACCIAAAAQVRAAIGFDRVMVYQFLHDGSGRVVAEDKADRLESFLGLHYPASDIPRQARELYRRNWLRLIPDVGYTPAPLHPLEAAPEDLACGRPLDMSCCALRAVSPIHLEYLRNMGVSASMSISIVMRDQLWGLIACHNHAPRYLTADLRASCELFGQVFSLHLEARIEADAARERLQARSVHEALAVRLPVATDIRAALVSGEVTLLDLIPAGGVAVWLDGEFATLGETPPDDFLSGLVAWLNELDRPVVDAFHFGAVYPPAIPFSAIASGMLAISLSRQPADYVMWFRPEAVRSITWAGDPRKLVEDGPSGERLMPRKSFDAWREEVRNQSTPWSAVEIDSAQAFRGWLLESVLRQVDLARKEREAALAHQNLLMAELDHRVKNTLASIQALVQQTRARAGSVDDFSAALDRRIRAMSHAHDLMSETRWRGASVRGLVEEELAPFRSDRNGSLLISGDDLMLSPKAALPFTLVVHELITNAAKYGALSTPSGDIRIGWHRREDGALVLTWKERSGPPVAVPTRRGFGSVVIERSLRHEIKGTSTLTFDADGVACVIVIPSEYVMPAERREA
jgi:chemotaxis family two-component system sensor kinase Cph1